ncbi:MAG: hypothetical protein A3B74_01805 [Candidatus Kerfeldbacteria bacterium RIFCSPHIGHO2_02_FULL_42_14]|uniref:CDP-2,3-bis-(O-geranylgeranyl)-sn-glycerol synthase n=1 Tax=Candidatus Kerfeldbacteria bacterium RIFCSPHIGHO2_02_FULL_42_14 TaxID=1798540 RepID=A0A1G2AS77_9BACT|nr:MAG: hypothetical protein A3B74_01805 [Candidatus Kerfeldbacteria bacterium RIFCSPHIGHO2_02_FULL_42_14]
MPTLIFQIGKFFLQCLWFFLPIGFANMAPVFARKINFLNVPVDFGYSIAHKRIFGDHKTWRGILAGVLIGECVFLLQRFLEQYPVFTALHFTSYQTLPWYFGALIGFGAVFGDLIKSFFKRRKNIAAGTSWIPFDQIDYILGGLIFSLIVVRIPLSAWLTILILGFLLHIATNHIGFWLGIREQRW